MINQNKLKKILRYDSLSGAFTRISGGIAGGPDERGYIRITVCGYRRRAQQWAWLYMTGKWPRLDVDHKDMDKGNNCWKNLRLATRTMNNLNRSRAAKNSISGLIGAHRNGKNLFVARIRVNGKRIGLGNFRTAQEAHAAYIAERRKHVSEYFRGGIAHG